MKFSKKVYPILLIIVLLLTAALKSGGGSVLPFRRMSVFTYPIYRQYKSEKVIKNLIKYGCSQEMVGDNIRVIWDKAEPRAVEVVVNNLESSMKRILQELDCSLPDKINVAILCDENLINIALDGHKIGFCMGVYFRGVVLVFEPSTWMESGFRDFDQQFMKDGPLVHELTHYIIDYKTKGNKPVWFSEGVALLEEYRINDTLGKYSEEITDFYSLKELQDDFFELDNSKAYTQSFLIVSFIADNFGMKSICDIMTELGRGKTMEQSVKRVLGISQRELFNESKEKRNQ